MTQDNIERLLLDNRLSLGPAVIRCKEGNVDYSDVKDTELEDEFGKKIKGYTLTIKPSKGCSFTVTYDKWQKNDINNIKGNDKNKNKI